VVLAIFLLLLASGLLLDLFEVNAFARLDGRAATTAEPLADRRFEPGGDRRHVILDHRIGDALRLALCHDDLRIKI